MKTLKNGQAVKLNFWKGNFEVARVMDCNDSFPTSDEERFYGTARTMMLTNDTSWYDAEEKSWANPIELQDGELVRMEANGKVYKVKDMGRGRFEYYSDILHFELQN